MSSVHPRAPFLELLTAQVQPHFGGQIRTCNSTVGGVYRFVLQ